MIAILPQRPNIPKNTARSWRPARRSRFAVAGALAAVLSVGYLPAVHASVPGNYTMTLPSFDATVHPRILATADGYDAIQARVNYDAIAEDLRTRVVSKADGLISTPPTTYPSNGGGLYEISQRILDRTTTLAVALGVTGDQRYADRLWGEWQVVAAYPSWGGHANDYLTLGTFLEAGGIALDSAYNNWEGAQRSALATAITSNGLVPQAVAYTTGAEWTTTSGNYNIVANAGTIVAALAVQEFDPDIAASSYGAAMASLQHGLAGFAGGGYREGFQYWSYALHHLVLLGSALRNSTGSHQGVLQAPGIAETGDNALYLIGPSRVPFDYGDSKAISAGIPALFVLADEFNRPELRNLAVEHAQLENINQFALLWFDPTKPTSTPAGAALPLDRRFSNSGVVTLRSSWSSEALFVGYKSATPTDNWHPQLDAGTFVLDALGERWATELGPDDYSLPGYFDGLPNGQRWSYYRNRAEGSNTLVIGSRRGADQIPTAESSIAALRSAADTAHSVSYLNASVEDVASTWKRGIRLINSRSEAVVQDEVISSSGNLDIWWNMHTDADITISADGKEATLTMNGKQLLARISSPGSGTFVQMAAQPLWTSPSPPGQATNNGNKLAIRLQNMNRVTVAVQFTPLRDGVPVGALAPVTALSAWATSPPAAQLTDLKIDGRTLDSFSPSTTSYDVALTRDVPPTVNATAAADTTVDIQQATSVPGVATVSVSRGGAAPLVYKIFLSQAKIPVVYSTASNSRSMSNLTRDGNLLTKWVGSGNQTLQYDFADHHDVSRVRVYWASPGSTSTRFGVLVSDNRSTWRTVFSSGLMKPGWNTYTIPTSTTKHIALLIDAGGVPTRFTGIHEVEFHSGNAGSTPTPPGQLIAATASLSSSTLNVGEEAQATVLARDSQGQVVAPHTYSLDWRSTDASVATVSSTGIVSPLAAGTASIVAVLTSNGHRLVMAPVAVTVTGPWDTSITASADSYVTNAFGQENSNFGDDQGLFVKTHPRFSNLNREAYIRFELPNLQASDVLSARLKFHAKTTDSGGTHTDVELREVLDDWDEHTVSYATKPRLGSLLGTTTISDVMTESSVDVSDYVRDLARVGNGSVDFGWTQESTEPSGLLVLVYGRTSFRPPVLEVTLATDPALTVDQSQLALQPAQSEDLNDIADNLSQDQTYQGAEGAPEALEGQKAYYSHNRGEQDGDSQAACSTYAEPDFTRRADDCDENVTGSSEGRVSSDDTCEQEGRDGRHRECADSTGANSKSRVDGD